MEGALKDSLAFTDGLPRLGDEPAVAPDLRVAADGYSHTLSGGSATIRGGTAVYSDGSAKAVVDFVAKRLTFKPTKTTLTDLQDVSGVTRITVGIEGPDAVIDVRLSQKKSSFAY